MKNEKNYWQANKRQTKTQLQKTKIDFSWLPKRLLTGGYASQSIDQTTNTTSSLMAFSTFSEWRAGLRRDNNVEERVPGAKLMTSIQVLLISQYFAL